MNPDDYIFTATLEVRDYEVDYQGIVNNSVYLNYMEHTRHLFCRQAGLSFGEMHRRGIDPVLARVEIDYRHPLRTGDTFISGLRVSRQGPLYVFRQDLFLPDGTLVAKGLIKVACMVNGRLTRGDELMETFREWLDNE